MRVVPLSSFPVGHKGLPPNTWDQCLVLRLLHVSRYRRNKGQLVLRMVRSRHPGSERRAVLLVDVCVVALFSFPDWP